MPRPSKILSSIGFCVDMSVRDDQQRRLLRMIDDMPVAVMTVDPETFLITYGECQEFRVGGWLNIRLVCDANYNCHRIASPEIFLC